MEAALRESVAVCGQCGSIVALFPEDLTWRHYRGSAVISRVQEVFDAGHEPAVKWYSPEEIPAANSPALCAWPVPAPLAT